MKWQRNRSRTGVSNAPLAYAARLKASRSTPRGHAALLSTEREGFSRAAGPSMEREGFSRALRWQCLTFRFLAERQQKQTDQERDRGERHRRADGVEVRDAGADEERDAGPHEAP